MEGRKDGRVEGRKGGRVGEREGGQKGGWLEERVGGRTRKQE